MDYIAIPQFGRNYSLASGGIYEGCKLNGQKSPTIIAIVKDQNTEYLDKVLKAWKADLQLGKIVKIETKGITCLNEGYGI